MNIIERVKNILLKPKEEWQVINQESDSPQSLLTKYVVPLALLGAVASLIGYGFIGFDVGFFKISGIKWGLYYAISGLLTSVLTFYICTYVIDALAPSFKSEKNIDKSAQLVAYASTAGAVAGLLNIFPALSVLIIIGALYGIYLFYTGISVMKKTPEPQVIGYMIVSALIIIVVAAVLGSIIHLILNQVIGNPFKTLEPVKFPTF